MERAEFHIDVDADGKTAVDLLSNATSLSRNTIKRAMQKGAAWLTRRQGTQRVRRADRVLQCGDRIHLYYDPDVLEQETPAARLVADEDVYSVWHKPYGMLSQGSKWGDHCTVSRWAETHLQPQRPAFVVHRLDRAASGLMIVAHAKRTATELSDLFRRRKVEKHYTALVHGHAPADLHIDQPIDGKSAVSHVIRAKFDHATNQTQIDVSIETGRKHQIRRHLAGTGFPIVGDRLYGDAQNKNDRDLCLVASRLAFISPVDGTPRRYELDTEQLAFSDTALRKAQ